MDITCKSRSLALLSKHGEREKERKERGAEEIFIFKERTWKYIHPKN